MPGISTDVMACAPHAPRTIVKIKILLVKVFVMECPRDLFLVRSRILSPTNCVVKNKRDVARNVPILGK